MAHQAAVARGIGVQDCGELPSIALCSHGNAPLLLSSRAQYYRDEITVVRFVIYQILQWICQGLAEAHDESCDSREVSLCSATFNITNHMHPQYVGVPQNRRRLSLEG